MNPLRVGLQWIGHLLAATGLIDGTRADRTTDLAWPRIVTGLARISQQVADLAMIGIVLGPPALAGLAFAFAYWQIGNTLSLGLSGGTISQVSRRYGAGDSAGVDIAIKTSAWLALVFSIPLAMVFVAIPETLIGLLGGEPETILFGSTYLGIVAAGLPFEFLNKVSSRALVGADDAHTPMLVRSTGAVLNLVINAILIFGLGMGVAGAALGTLIATGAVTGWFTIGFLRGRLPGVGAFPITVSARPPFYGVSMGRELITIATPLMGRWLAQTLAVFPLLAIVATFGSVVVAAFEVGRRIRMLITTPNWGFALAASSLVGQSLGEDNEDVATAYGWEILWFSLVVHVLTGMLVIVFAHPIASVFVSSPTAITETVPFVRIAAVSVIGIGIDGVTTGVLRAGGDTRWPLYGKLLGLYVVTIPMAYLGVITPLGVMALYAALLTETVVPAIVSYYRFNTERWVTISRTFRSTTAD